MKTGVAFPALLILMLLAAGYKGRVNAQQSYSAPGLEVGDTIPQFSLPDQHGRMQDFRSLSGPNGLIILFFRSASW